MIRGFDKIVEEAKERGRLLENNEKKTNVMKEDSKINKEHRI